MTKPILIASNPPKIDWRRAEAVTGIRLDRRFSFYEIRGAVYSGAYVVCRHFRTGDCPCGTKCALSFFNNEIPSRQTLVRVDTVPDWFRTERPRA